MALTKLLTDADRRSVMQLFTPDSVRNFHASFSDIKRNYLVNGASVDAFLAAQQVYSTVFYELLRGGRDADVSSTALVFDPNVLAKLGTQYMDVPKDPFGSLYQFWPGPWDKNAYPTIPFRCWRATKGPVKPGETGYLPYRYDDQAYAEAQMDLPGNPRSDDVYPGVGIAAFGYPASAEEVAYVWSVGENLVTDQLVARDLPDDEHKGGGDDINSWDKGGGWSRFYN
ncbi:MAG: hypothetical protein HZB26_12285 [Candidatus Hydrogenedentes bacterium]|nr:hypothetical protein [Candidatus Hydrogenedentota bacterium]